MEELNYINLNGKQHLAGAPVLSAQNRAFRYGDAVFESMRVINGTPCFLSDHLDRIMRSLQVLKIELREGYNVSYLTQQINELLQQNQITRGGKIRLTVFRDGAGLYTPEVNTGSFLIEATPLKDEVYTLNEEGLIVDLYEGHQKPINKLATIKSGNALFFVLAGLYKKERQLDECILLNELATIAEAISSNIFVVFNGVLYTPSINQGCLPGIMRKQVIEIAKANNIEVQECPLNPAVLLKAEEIFLTNAVHGVRWVMGYRSMRYYDTMARSMVTLLNERVANLAMDLQESST